MVLLALMSFQMNSLYLNILEYIRKKERQLAVLIDPDKLELHRVARIISKIEASAITHIFVGGSEVEEDATDILVREIKKYSKLPVILFPGDITQVSEYADGLLFLSLISGRNPDYLIEKHVQSVSKLRTTTLEVIPTGYLLIENGKKTSVERISKTRPLKRCNIDEIVDTAKAGELLGMKLIYLEAGSGATHSIEPEIISRVKQDLKIPLIVGGGIRTKKELELAYTAGANMVVIGTAFEKDETFFEVLKKKNETVSR
jgi:phosphoglycerol geranylgeranyltransferase